MKTNQTVKLLTVAALALASPLSWAGEKAGNGGGAIACRNSQGTLVKAYFLDTWEASHLKRKDNGYKTLYIPRDNENSKEGQIANALHKIAEFNGFAYEKIKDAVDVVNANLQPELVKVRRLEDSNDFATPDDEPGLECERVQLANYTGEYGIVANQRILGLLDATDQAALILHEAIYKVERDLLGATNSDHTRKVVGYLFSDSPLSSTVMGPLARVCMDLDVSIQSYVGRVWSANIVTNNDPDLIHAKQTLFYSTSRKDAHLVQNRVRQCGEYGKKSLMTMYIDGVPPGIGLLSDMTATVRIQNVASGEVMLNTTHNSVTALFILVH